MIPRTEHSTETGGQVQSCILALDAMLAFFGTCITLLIHPALTADISYPLMSANNDHGCGASQITKSFQKHGLFYSSLQPSEVD